MSELLASEQIRVHACNTISEAIADLVSDQGIDSQEWLMIQARQLGEAIAAGHAAFMNPTAPEPSRSTPSEPCEAPSDTPRGPLMFP